MGRRRFHPLGLAWLAVVVLAAAAPAQAEQGGRGFRQIHGPGLRHAQPAGGGHRHVHGRARIGIGIQLGPGFFYPSYPYPYPGYHPGYYSSLYPAYVYGPAPIVLPASPQYIERGDEAQGEAGEAPAYWYHCAEPEGYYPHVAACPGGWRTVPAQPPATR
ncbi:hypothetical protein [Ramlibacter sp. 2FC]|uniref:hypothetical protein n=1 Tax=Ramlibacter sp. 2FC TaxID=2502188 RepID=UPI0010FA0E53|nr:hypothetical protein [Ramlibacter sp. 2FC]